jgi:hypothetical protein
MAGHSHSANIKHRKNAVDAKRGKIFSKLERHIISAARQGGADIDGNLKLKYAVEKARAANMPKDNIERAIKRGSGDKDGSDFEELGSRAALAARSASPSACWTERVRGSRRAPRRWPSVQVCAFEFSLSKFAEPRGLLGVVTREPERCSVELSESWICRAEMAAKVCEFFRGSIVGSRLRSASKKEAP